MLRRLLNSVYMTSDIQCSLTEFRGSVCVSRCAAPFPVCRLELSRSVCGWQQVLGSLSICPLDFGALVVVVCVGLVLKMF